MPSRLPFFLLCLALPLAAHALCTSDGVPPPSAVLERFINADCASCWADPATPQPRSADTVVLDWVVPGSKGEEAPLSAVASPDAMERLAALGRKVPETIDASTGQSEAAGLSLRLAQGGAFNDYMGASIELLAPSRDRWQAWLMLVEQLPAGTEGSPVARNLVRNVFRPDWVRGMVRAPMHLAETRAMQIHDGARPERLRLVAVVQDARGRIRAISQTACSE